MKLSTVVFVLACVVGASAQVDAPTLTPEQNATLQLWETRIEAAQLRLNLAQLQLEMIRRDAESYVRSLEQKGFTLQRGDRGWTYVPESKP